MTATIIPDLSTMPATMTIPEVARLLRISRSAAYRAAARGEIPTIRIGRRLLVPTAKLYAMLGWTDSPTDQSPPARSHRPATTLTTTHRPRTGNCSEHSSASPVPAS